MHRVVRMGKIGAGRKLERERADQQVNINAILSLDSEIKHNIHVY